MADFTMPALGADMENGQVVEWLVAPGARVKPGDIVAVVETHKGAIDVECFLDGVIDDLAPTGQDLPVGAPAGACAPGGEALCAGARPAAAAPAAAATPAAAAAPPAAVARFETSALPAGLAQRVKVSPAARRHAQALGLDAEALVARVSTVPCRWPMWIGPRRSPARRHCSAPPRPRRRLVPRRRQPPAEGGFDPAQMRRAIAAAMGRSKREIPHYYLSTTVDFAAASGWLAGYNGERDPAERLLPATLLLKAAARALVEVPQLNGHYENDAFPARRGHPPRLGRRAAWRWAGGPGHPPCRPTGPARADARPA